MSRHRDERGAVTAVVVALVAAGVLFGLASLVVDLGLARDQDNSSQVTADSAALAAANVLYPHGGYCSDGTTTIPCVSDAVAAAKGYGEKNFNVTASEWSACPPPPAGFTAPDATIACVSFDNTSWPTKVWVKLPDRVLKDGFAAGSGNDQGDTVRVARRSQASLTPGKAGACGLCVIGEGTHDLQNGDGVVTTGDIFLNGTVTMNPGGVLKAESGTVNFEGDQPSKGTVSPSPPATNVVPVPDPLGSIPLPKLAGQSAKSTTDMCAGGPGIYYNPSTPTCSLTAGLYTIIGGTIGGNTTLTANNVTFFFTCHTATSPYKVKDCTSGDTPGSLDLSGNGNYTITAPTIASAGSIPGVALAWDRNANVTVKLVGNGSLNVTGAIYMKSGTLDMRGNGCTATTSVDSLVVTDDLSFSGNNACLKTADTTSKQVQRPPSYLALSQ